MMFGSSLVLRRLLPRVSPRVLCVASNLLSGCNDAINTIGCTQSRHKSGRFILPNANLASRRIEPAQGLLQFHTRCWNLTSIRSYGRPRFSPEHLTEAQIIDAVKSGKYNMDDVALCFSRKQLYKQKQFSAQFRRELGDLFVGHFSSLKHIDGKTMLRLLNALINLKYPTDPCFINLPLRSMQNGCGDKKLYNDFLQQAGLLPLLKWKMIPPRDKLVLICQLVMPMMSAAEDRYLTYLLHTWCKDKGTWRQIAREYLITDIYLRECQRRFPKIDVKHLTQLLEAVSDSLPLPSHVQLPPGWLADVQKCLLSLCIPRSDPGAAATLLDAFMQIQQIFCPSQLELNIPVAKRMFKVWFDPKQKCIARIQTLTFLVLRAMGEVGIDPGDLDERFWPWFWKEIDNLLNEKRDDGRAMVLGALFQLKIPAPTRSVQKIVNMISAQNPMLASDLLHSLVRIKEYTPGLKILDKTKRSLAEGYIDSLPFISGKHLVLGTWSLAQMGLNPADADDNFWKKFYQHSERHMNQFTCHQQTMLLTVLFKFYLEPPIEWFKMLIAAIDRTPPDSAAHMLWNLMFLDRHLSHKATENKGLLHISEQKQEQRISKSYNHWMNTIEDLNARELLFPLYVMAYFGLEAKVGQSDIEKWCKCMGKNSGTKWSEEDGKILKKIFNDYNVASCFRNKILKE